MLHGVVLAKTPPLFSFFVKIPIPLILRSSRRVIHHFHRHPPPPISTATFSVEKRFHLCTLALSNDSRSSPSSSSVAAAVSNKAKKKARRESPEGLLRHKLDMCSRSGDVVEALRLYDEGRSAGVPLSLHHYNCILYLCSSNGGDDVGLQRGFEIFRQMIDDEIVPNEATFTSAARLAAAAEDPEMAFHFVKQMKGFGIPPKLRSYGPALFGFCNKGEANRAYEVDAHMIESGVLAEEDEISALLRVSGGSSNGDKAYDMLHRLRSSVRQVSEATCGVVEEWFKSETAVKVGVERWDVNKVREGVVRGGGGWHGQGWLGSGDWKVVRTQMDGAGTCSCCGERLVSIDIDPKETENFAASLCKLASKKEVRADFVRFQEWLQRHGPFDAVIDGANVGLVNQRSLSFSQLNALVNRLRQLSPTKRLPLVILHQSRVTGGPAQNPNNKKLLDSWKKSGALYATPAGSNDDWYWLYAAVNCKCLLVTNDEMRDHLFQLLGTSFFPRWKEKHQVRMSVSRGGIQLHMPPPYSIVIQESEDGQWHVPTTTGDDIETPRQWLCATRARNTK